jgi:hypothetical protein
MRVISDLDREPVFRAYLIWLQFNSLLYSLLALSSDRFQNFDRPNFIAIDRVLDRRELFPSTTVPTRRDFGV